MSKWEKREDGEKAESRAEGTSASAITKRTGAEKRSSDITMVIKKNTTFTPLHTLLDFSSFENPIIFLIPILDVLQNYFFVFIYKIVKGKKHVKGNSQEKMKGKA